MGREGREPPHERRVERMRGSIIDVLRDGLHHGYLAVALFTNWTIWAISGEEQLMADARPLWKRIHWEQKTEVSCPAPLGAS